jgi:hypothetical protein
MQGASAQGDPTAPPSCKGVLHDVVTDRHVATATLPCVQNGELLQEVSRVEACNRQCRSTLQGINKAAFEGQVRAVCCDVMCLMFCGHAVCRVSILRRAMQLLFCAHHRCRLVARSNITGDTLCTR